MNAVKPIPPQRPVTLALQRLDASGVPVLRRYLTEVEHSSTAETWVVQPRGERDEPVAVRPGERVLLEVGHAAGFSSMSAVMRRTVNIRGADVLIFEITGQAERRQRRADVRVPTMLPASITIEGRKHPGIARNLSAGGMQILLDQRGLAVASSKEVSYSLTPDEKTTPPEDRRTLVGKAAYVRSDGPGLHAYRFIGLSEADRQWLVRYVFRRQVELRQRNLDATV